MDKAGIGTIFTVFITGLFFGLGFTISAIAICALITCLGGWLW